MITLSFVSFVVSLDATILVTALPVSCCCAPRIRFGGPTDDTGAGDIARAPRICS
jgi:hypothetical protein